MPKEVRLGLFIVVDASHPVCRSIFDRQHGDAVSIDLQGEGGVSECIRPQ